MASLESTPTSQVVTERNDRLNDALLKALCENVPTACRELLQNTSEKKKPIDVLAEFPHNTMMPNELQRSK
jgi:hypothetical protein